MKRLLVCLLLVLSGVFAVQTVRALGESKTEEPRGKSVNYLADIKPLLRDKCFCATVHANRKVDCGWMRRVLFARAARAVLRFTSHTDYCPSNGRCFKVSFSRYSRTRKALSVRMVCARPHDHAMTLTAPPPAAADRGSDLAG